VPHTFVTCLLRPSIRWLCPLIVALSYARRVGGYELGLGADMPWGRLAGVSAAVRCARATVLISIGGREAPIRR
jgi:hypothetical protein